MQSGYVYICSSRTAAGSTAPSLQCMFCAGLLSCVGLSHRHHSVPANTHDSMFPVLFHHALRCVQACCCMGLQARARRCWPRPLPRSAAPPSSTSAPAASSASGGATARSLSGCVGCGFAVWVFCGYASVCLVSACAELHAVLGAAQRPCVPISCTGVNCLPASADLPGPCAAATTLKHIVVRCHLLRRACPTPCRLCCCCCCC
jgi:hypothetical protein